MLVTGAISSRIGAKRTLVLAGEAYRHDRP
jgi:hypothetical protein